MCLFPGFLCLVFSSLFFFTHGFLLRLAPSSVFLLFPCFVFVGASSLYAHSRSLFLLVINWQCLKKKKKKEFYDFLFLPAPGASCSNKLVQSEKKDYTTLHRKVSISRVCFFVHTCTSRSNKLVLCVFSSTSLTVLRGFSSTFSLKPDFD